MGKLIPEAAEPDYPLSFHFARTLHTLLRGHRGQYYLYHLLGRAGLLERAGRFGFFDGEIYIPLKVPETIFVNDFSLFLGLCEVQLAFQLNTLFPHFTLINCGAYFGQISMRLAKLCPGLDRIVLVDPSSENCEYASANLSLTGKPFDRVHAAVSDHSGMARLVYPHGTDVPDSAYIERSESGDIQVKYIDDIRDDLSIDPAGQNFALKLDVEGEEIAAIHGGADLLRKAAAVCLFVELHSGALARKGRDARDLLGAVGGCRPVRWYSADQPELELDPMAPIFEQLGQQSICDVIGLAGPPTGSGPAWRGSM